MAPTYWERYSDKSKVKPFLHAVPKARDEEQKWADVFFTITECCEGFSFTRPGKPVNELGIKLHFKKLTDAGKNLPICPPMIQPQIQELFAEFEKFMFFMNVQWEQF